MKNFDRKQSILQQGNENKPVPAL